MNRRRPPRLHSRVDPSLLGASEVASLLDQVCSGLAPLVAPARDILRQARPDVVASVAAPRCERDLDRLIRTGWMPTELVWAASRKSPTVGQALLQALAAHMAELGEVPLAPAWSAQLAELRLVHPEFVTEDAGRWRDAAALRRQAATLVRLAEVMAALGPVEVLAPVPGHPQVPLSGGGAGGADSSEGIDAKVLKKVRALLAKAESTTFEHEAQALTAKAHQLMNRHSLEHLVVSAEVSSGDRPCVRRFCLDDPYSDSKAILLSVLADCCRCKAVLHGSVPMVTVVGFASDLATVDVLLTSLLVQAQTSLEEVGRGAVAGSRERSRGFRSSFLRGFALRIGERLRSTAEATLAEFDTSQGGALVPVLAQRDEAVAAELAIMHPSLRVRPASAPTDALGWHAGQRAAEAADMPWSKLDSR